MLTGILILAAVLFVGYKLLLGKPKNFPPGPMGLPLIGHLPLLGTNPAKTFLQWREKYGPMVGVNFGSYRTVVISDGKLIREAMNQSTFSGRPDMRFFKDRSGGMAKGIVFTDGHHWLEQRRFVLRNLRDFGFGTKSMEAKVQEEIVDLCEQLKATEGKPVQVRNLFNAPVVNALWSIMLGERMKQDDPELKKAIHGVTASVTENNTLAGLAMFMPWLTHLAPKLSGYQHMMKEMPPLVAFVEKHIKKHLETHVEDQPRDLTDIFADEVKKTTDKQSSFHKDLNMLTFSILDLFLAGSETTSTTLTWLLAYLVTWPEHQKKLHAEIDQVIGKERLPSLSDRPNMPYLDALTCELLRKSALVPFAIFHNTTEDVEFHGYTIPKDTMIMPNLWGALMDEKVWGDPENFRPERFLEPGAKAKKTENLIPFSTGKRVCLGESLARDELFLFITTLFQKFEIKASGKLPNLEPIIAIVLLPHPFEVIFKERV